MAMMNVLCWCCRTHAKSCDTRIRSKRMPKCQPIRWMWTVDDDKPFFKDSRSDWLYWHVTEDNLLEYLRRFLLPKLNRTDSAIVRLVRTHRTQTMTSIQWQRHSNASNTISVLNFRQSLESACAHQQIPTRTIAIERRKCPDECHPTAKCTACQMRGSNIQSELQRKKYKFNQIKILGLFGRYDLRFKKVNAPPK